MVGVSARTRFAGGHFCFSGHGVVTILKKKEKFTRAGAPDFLRLAHPKVGAGATPVQGNLYCSEAQCVHQPPTLSPQLSALSAQLSAPRAQLLARLRWTELSWAELGLAGLGWAELSRAGLS